MNVTFKDNSKVFSEAMQEAAIRGLEKCGLTAETYAKRLAHVVTGLLRNSITHAISGQPAAISKYTDDAGEQSGTYSGNAPEERKGKAVYIGSNVEYAPYVELGSGRKTSGGRPTSWIYTDDNGETHKTGGSTEQPFLKPAVADHAKEYRQTIEGEMKNA